MEPSPLEHLFQNEMYLTSSSSRALKIPIEEEGKTDKSQKE